MDTLHKALLTKLSELGPAAATALVAKKLAKRRLRLSNEQARQLAAYFAGRRKALPRFRFTGSAQRKIAIRITPGETQRLMARLERVLVRLPKTFHPLVTDLADGLLPTFKKHWPTESRKRARSIAAFEARLLRRWQRPIDELRLQIAISKDYGVAMTEAVRARRPRTNPISADLLIRLHGRACQVADEIALLLSHGFADGAMARWRTLHEIAVTAMFLSEHGEPAAERYVIHDIVEVRKAAHQYQLHCRRLKSKRLSARELNRTERHYQAALARFGRHFKEQYGWASAALGKSKPTFADIEIGAGVEHLRPYYKLASHNVHANPRGVFFRLGMLKERQMILAGPSDAGLSDPGQSAAISLAQLSAAICRLHPTLDSCVMAKLIGNLADDVAQAFAIVRQ